MSSIPETHRDLLTEKTTYATVTTMLPDGLPHLSLVWIDYDEAADRVLVNTERGRRKEKNVRNDPRAGILAPDPDSHFRWLAVSGEVDRLREEGAREHADALAKRYLGEDTYGRPIETKRVIMELRPDHVVPFGEG